MDQSDWVWAPGTGWGSMVVLVGWGSTVVLVAAVPVAAVLVVAVAGLVPVPVPVSGRGCIP